MSSLLQALSQLEASIPLDQLTNAYAQLSQAYRRQSALGLSSHELRVAYVLARMPATVGALKQVFSHLDPDNITSLVDLGSGPGSVLWALEDFDGIRQALCLDQNPDLMNLGAEIFTSPERMTVKRQVQKLNQNVEFPAADLITMSYALNEIKPPHRTLLLSSAWQSCQKAFVIVEPGTPAGFENIKNARQYLIEQGAYIQAPCTHEQTCPMSQSDWCHFSTRVQRSDTHRRIKGRLPYEDEKYSYVIALKDKPLPRPSARIIKKPQKSSGLVQIDVCDKDGLKTEKISKKQGPVYKQARKYEWGDGV